MTAKMYAFTFLFFLLSGNLFAGQSLYGDYQVKVSEGSLGAVFAQIEKQTPYAFAYSNAEVDIDASVRLAAKETELGKVLDLISEQHGLSFSRNDKTIYVKKKKAVGKIQQIPAQSPVKGIVKDETGMPVPGATVFEKGTQNAVVTDENGSFAITVSGGNAILVVTYIGFADKEVIVGDTTYFDISLQSEAKTLSEVVVIGYGSQKQSKITGAIAKAPLNEMKDYPVANFDQALVGKMAGVQVIQSSGEPGRELDIRVRGTGTITAGVSPLYVIDGVPIENSGQATEIVNVEDIESIQVLKDASSAAIYGSRGANGVVLITTKKGKEGKMRVNFNQSYGTQSVSRTIDMMDAYQYAQFSRDAHNAAYLQDVPTGNPNDPNSVRPIGYQKIPEELFPYINGEKGLTNTDWQDAIFRDAPISRYNISIDGGNKLLNYYVSANHTNQEGIIINSGYRKTIFKTNLGLETGKLKMGLSLSPSYTIENRVNASGPFGEDGIVASALGMSPTWSVYNADGSYNFQGNGYWRIGTDYQHNELLNPVAVANLIKNQIKHYNVLSNLFLEYEILPKVSYKSSFGVNFNAYDSEYYRPSILQVRGSVNYNKPAPPQGATTNTNLYNWVFENTINYKDRFGLHNFEALGGITAQKSSSRFNSTTATVTADTPVRNAIQVINADQLANSDSSLQQWSLYSLLARVQYDFDSKYLLSTSFRADASSRFGADSKWGYFPSISAGWRISQEEFLRESTWLSELKVRSSYGLTGNFQIGNYRQLAAITQDNYILGNGQIISGLGPSQPENKDLSWEKTAMFNLGVDMEFFDKQLGLTFDYYNSNTSDLLLEVPVPLTTGFSTSLQNLGEVNNRGVEFTLNLAPKMGDFQWTGNFNISANRNKVVSLGPNNSDIITTTGADSAYFITRVGEAIGSYYLLDQDGVFMNQQELDAYPHFANTKVGDFRFKDVDGDGTLDVNKDRKIVGNYMPDFTYGFSNSFAYGGFDLNIAFQGSQGGEILNLQRRYIANGEGNMNNTTEMLDRWVSESNPGDGNTNRANRKASGNNARISTWHVEDGSYLRLQNVSLGYSFPKSLMETLKINSLRLFVTGNNIHTWTKYSGYNPEVNYAGANNQLTPGVDYGTYPLATTYSFGINVSF